MMEFEFPKSLDKPNPFLSSAAMFDTMAMEDDGFMVVPSAMAGDPDLGDQSSNGAALDDQFLLDINFNETVGSILSPTCVDPFASSIDFPFSSLPSAVILQHPAEIDPHQQFIDAFNDQFPQLQTPVDYFNVDQEGAGYLDQDPTIGGFKIVDDIGSIVASSDVAFSVEQNQYFVGDEGETNGFGFDGGVSEEMTAGGNQWLAVDQVGGDQQLQFSELKDPNAMWAECRIDLNFDQIDDDQQSRLLDELLRDDGVFAVGGADQIGGEISIDQTGGGDDAIDMFEEILRDAGIEEDEQKSKTQSVVMIDYGKTAAVAETNWVGHSIVGTRTNVTASRSTVSKSTVRPSSMIKPSSSQHHRPAPIDHASRRQHQSRSSAHLSDHDFGYATRRGRPPGSTNGRKTKQHRNASGGGGSKKELKFKKQQQNREAALRYRWKKKAEKMEDGTKLEQLEKRNQKLKNEVSILTDEVQYMKELFATLKRVRKG